MINPKIFFYKTLQYNIIITHLNMIDTSICIFGHSSFTLNPVLREAAKKLIIPITFDEISFKKKDSII